MREQSQQGLGDSVARLGAPPVLPGSHHGDGGQTVVVRDDRQPAVVGELERVERLSQPTSDAAHRLVR